MVEITEVKNEKELEEFVKFPFGLYKGSKYWVPPLINGEIKTFSPQHNPTLEFCDTCLIVARKDGRVQGRMALIINKRENEMLGQKKLRFGWLDFTDDGEVTQALFAYAQKWGAGHGMEYMEGPVGFCNLDKAAMLTWGFDELSNTTALYNYPYYPVHMEANGFEKCTQWIESEMKVPDRVPDKIRRFSSLLKEKYSRPPPI